LGGSIPWKLTPRAILSHIKFQTPKDKAGIRIVLENIEEYCDCQAILETLAEKESA